MGEFAKIEDDASTVSREQAVAYLEMSIDSPNQALQLTAAEVEVIPMSAIIKNGQLKMVESESTTEKTLAVPISVLQQVLDEDSSEPLEDWLMVTNPKFIRETTKAQEDVKAGKGIQWKKVKEQLGIK